MFNRSLSAIALSLLLVVALVAACSPAANRPDATLTAGGSEQAGVAAGKRSTAFVPNAGQLDPAVLFRTLGSASTLFFARHEVVLSLPSPAEVTRLFSHLLRPSNAERVVPADAAILRLHFEGGNPDTQVIGQDQLAGIVNYYLGNDPAGWRTGIPTYGRIAYEQIYPGIDLLYGGSGGFLKGTYVVAPGADPGTIRWRYDGASSVKLSKGALQIRMTESGDVAPIVEQEPVAWQTVDGQRTAVPVRYVVHRDGSIGFAVGKYDAAWPLLIDPTLDYSTYVGSSRHEGVYDMALDSDNAVYVTGPEEQATLSSDLRTTEVVPNIQVIKLDLSQTGANQVVYTTYIGGSEFDSASGIAVDANGRAYVAGFTESDDFPTTLNAYDRTYHGGYADGVAIRLNASGAVQYATFLGGEGWDEPLDVAVDDSLMYVVGSSSSTDFPKTADAFQGSLASADFTDAVVSVLDPSKSGAASLVYSTYYGGTDSDEGWAIDVVGGIAYFAGNTQSDDLALKDATQGTFQGPVPGWGDAYLVKLDRSKSGNAQLLFATYLGGTDDEVSGGLAVDTTGTAYWVGVTASTDFPTTTVSLPYAGGDWDAFLVKLDTTPPGVVYSQLLGGSGDDGFRGAAFDPFGNVFVAGGTGSDDIPLERPIQDTFGGGVASLPSFNWLGAGDGLVAEFEATGTITFSTYLGGTGADAILGIGLDPLGKVYVAGGTESTDLETVNPYQAANAGGFDCFVAVLGGLAAPRLKLYLPLVMRNH
jgi:hypothetical protein